MKKILTGIMALSFATCLSSNADAAGFFIQEQSVSGLGAAFAGQAAMPRDASTIFFNPAGMTYLNGTTGNIGVHLLAPHSDVDDTGTVNTSVGGPFPTPAVGGDTNNPYDIEAVPNAFLSHQINDRHWVGLGVTAPFGLANQYDEDYFARFDSTETDLLTINVQPSYATKISDRLSFGAGVDIQYVDAKLNSAVQGLTEGTSSLEGDDVSFGYNLGFMYDVTDQTRLGLHYRSQVNHKLDGESTVTGTTIADGVTQAGANLNLPEMVNFGASHKLNEDWTLMGGATWFGWSNFERITVTADDGTQLQDQAQNYKNTWAFNLGAEYEYSPEWTFRGGVQYDETPTQDGFRSTRTPDGDRIWVSGGATYTMNERWSFDVAATYINIGKENIDLTRVQGTAVSDINAESDGHVGILAVGLNYKF